MAKVVVYEGEDISSAIRRFNKRVMKDGIMDECRKREFFRKPSDIRKEKARKAKKLAAIANSKNKKAEY